MPKSYQHDFRTTELDPDLLLTSFAVQTKWHVITGAVSCGKTTLVNLLAEKGFKTVQEGARLFIESEIARGRTIEQIRTNSQKLQQDIKDVQLCIERGLRVIDFAFLDRAVPDCLAWYRLFGLNPNKILHDCFEHRYASVFILDPLPLQLDGIRFENKNYSDFLDEWHTRDYCSLGYNVVRVPVLSPEERVAFVIKVLSEQGLI